LFESETACKAAARPPNDASISVSGFSFEFNQLFDSCRIRYEPFADYKKEATYKRADYNILSLFPATAGEPPDGHLESKFPCTEAAQSCGAVKNSVLSESQNACVNVKAKEDAILNFQKALDEGGPNYPPVCDWFKADSQGPFSCTKIKPSTNPKTKDEAIAWFKTNKAATSICEIYKADTSGPYLCTPTPSGAFPTTNDEAVAYYKKNYNADAICAPLKDNAPFQCTGSEQKSIFEIVSLSYSNAEMIFGLLGSMIVFFLYKCKRAKDPDALDEDALMDRLEALEANNKRLDADNKELKANVGALEAWKALERNQIATFGNDADAESLKSEE
jgi:hypothetical protein